MPSRTILGGPNILGVSGTSAANRYFYRTYSGISYHKYVSFTLVMWYFDDWSTRNYLPSLKFLLDSYTVTGPSLLYSNDFTGSEGGNSAEKDLGFDHIMGGTPHSGSSMYFRILESLTDTVDSRRFGFREISFTFSNYSGPVPPLYHRSEEITSLSYGQCSCPIGQAVDEAGSSCVDCAAGCKKCFGPFASQCFQCDPGLLWTGSQCCDPKCSVCSGVTSDECSACYPPYYNYLNGTCKDNCPSPFKNTTQGGQNFCNKPCKAGEYYYIINQTCLSKCPSPLDNYINDTILYCFNPCDPAAQFLFTNGTCLDSCPPLLSTRNESGVQYCFNPCPNYIFTSNGTCLTSCPFPLSIYQDPGVKYCFNPCTDPSYPYLFPNASCLSDCPAPLASRTEPGGVQYCFNPCTLPAYLYPNGTCSSQCLFPLVSRTEPDVTYCFNPCSSYDIYLYLNQSCIATCPTPLVVKTESVAKYCYNPCPDPVNQFLFQNRSCLANCPSPLVERHEPDVKYCFNPCTPTQFLFVNQSCSDICPLPLASRIEPGVKYCYNPCTSPSTQYLYSNGTCSLQCILPLATKTDTDARYCYNPCGSTSLFLYTNQSCFSDCFSPLASRTEPGVKYCFNPCADPVNDFLFPNRSCFSTCPYPLKSRQESGVKYCYNSCSLSSFLYWNQSCSFNCPIPLVPKFEPGVNYCINPCPSPTTQLLYTNGSCMTTCPAPLHHRSEPGVKYCFNPCQYPWGFLYTNGSCSNRCPIPLISRSEPDVDYCFAPCKAPNIYWYINFTCHSVCNYPYVKILYSGVQQCLSPCQNETDYFYKDENKCESTCDPPFMYSQADKVRVCYSELSYNYDTIAQARDTFKLIKSLRDAANVLVKFPALLQTNSPYSAFLGSYSSMAQYVRHMGINYSDKLAALFIVSEYIPVTTSFGFELPQNLQENLADYSLPKNFDKYEIHSNFLWNTWGLLESLLIALALIIVALILSRKYKATFKPRIILEKFLQIMQWNIPLMMLSSSSTDIFFFGVLHLRSAHLNSFLSALSLFAALAMIFIIIWMISCVFRIVWALKKAKKNPSDEAILFQEYRIKQTWKNYGLLFHSLSEKSLIRLIYVGVFILRGLIFSLVITCLYKFPLAQASLLLVLNSLMLIYFIFFRPLKRALHRVQVLVNEILLMILTTCVFSLAVFDSHKIESQQTRDNLGEAIIIMIISLNAFAIASLSINLLLDVYSLYKKAKLLRLKIRLKGVQKSIFSLIPLVIFEELQTDPKLQELLNRPEISLDPNKKRRIFKPSRKGPTTASSQFHIGPINMLPESYQSMANTCMTTEDVTPTPETPELPLAPGDVEILSENSLNKTFDLGKSPDESRAVIDSQDYALGPIGQKVLVDNYLDQVDQALEPKSTGKNTIISLFKRLRGKSSRPSQPVEPKPKDQKTKIKKPEKKQPSGFKHNISKNEPRISQRSEPPSWFSGVQLPSPQNEPHLSISQPSQFVHLRVHTAAQSENNKSTAQPSQFSGLRLDTSPNESRPVSQESQLSGSRLHIAQNENIKSIEGEKAFPTLERDESGGSIGSEITIKSRNTLVQDFRRLRERQNRTKNQRKNWYDNLRKSND